MEPVEFVAAQGLPVRVGNRARDDVTGLYRLKDGDVFITIVNEGRWQRLCNTIGVAELIDDPRYATVALRKERLPELRDIVQARLGRLTCEQGIALLEKAEIPVSRVRGLSEALHDEHFRARGTLRPMRRSGSTAPVEGGVLPGLPLRFSGGELPQLDGGADLGQHNAEVYGRLLGLDAAALGALKARGVV
jgi:formyl-CoA transferase